MIIFIQHWRLGNPFHMLNFYFLFNYCSNIGCDWKSYRICHKKYKIVIRNNYEVLGLLGSEFKGFPKVPERINEIENDSNTIVWFYPKLFFVKNFYQIKSRI